MKKTFKIPMIFLLSIIVFSGCSSKSEEEAVNEAKEIAMTTFESEAEIEANNEVDGLPMYIPKKLDIQSENENNLILEDGNQTYLVFRNTIEDSKSTLNYQSAKTNTALVLESFENDEQYGYIRILPETDDGYELQVGIGGVKITTYTSKRKMTDDAEEMMKMAKYFASMEQ